MDLCGFHPIQSCRLCEGYLRPEDFGIELLGGRNGQPEALARMWCRHCQVAWEVLLAYDRHLSQYVVQVGGVFEYHDRRNVQRVADWLDGEIIAQGVAASS